MSRKFSAGTGVTAFGTHLGRRDTSADNGFTADGGDEYSAANAKEGCSENVRIDHDTATVEPTETTVKVRP